MNQRYPVPVALRRTARRGQVSGPVVLPGLLARSGQAQLPCALASGSYAKNFAGISTGLGQVGEGARQPCPVAYEALVTNSITRWAG